MMAARTLPAETSALMAALRLTLSPDDTKALTDLTDAAQQMVAVEGETETRRAFRVAAQICAADPAPAHREALRQAMNDFTLVDLKPHAPPPEDPRWLRRTHCTNGVAVAQPRDPADLYTDM